MWRNLTRGRFFCQVFNLTTEPSPLSGPAVRDIKEESSMEETLGAVIARKRQEKGLSQRELAAAVKVSNSTIARLERNEILLPGSDLIRALSQELGVDYNYLLAMTRQIDDEPEIRIIQRAAHSMSQEDRQRMVEILRLAFRDAFADVRDDEGNRR